MKILADSTLPDLEHWFKSPFELNYYDTEKKLYKNLKHHDILICRSTLQVTEALIQNSALRCVATASSGSDHLDKIALKKHHIRWIDAKGCNARSVENYVVSVLAWLSKSQCLLEKQIGIIGYGAVGKTVNQTLSSLGFITHCYDPLLEQTDRSFQSCALNDLMGCDILCIHANLHDNPPFPSRHLINMNFLNQLKDKTVLINAARGGLVDEQALLQHLPRLIYCTDVYQNEPNINPLIVQHAALCTPHIAGHSIEAKKKAVIFLAQKLYAFYAPTEPAPLFSERPVRSSPRRRGSTLKYHYDPSKESKLLKQSHDPQEAFIQLRKAHQHRHEVVI